MKQKRSREHQSYLKLKLSIPPELEQQLSASDSERLKKYGILALKLSTGQTQPEKESHRRLLRVVKGEIPPSTPFEHAWMKYVAAIRLDATGTKKGSRLKPLKTIRAADPIDRTDNWDESAIH
jgi:uncharacterized protein YifE (UPF0438 family)